MFRLRGVIVQAYEGIKAKPKSRQSKIYQGALRPHQIAKKGPKNKMQFRGGATMTWEYNVTREDDGLRE